MTPFQTFSEITSALPKARVIPNIDAEINAIRNKKLKSIIVLDDDPTGTQTVYDTPVLTKWSTSIIAAELEKDTKLFFILTNSRSRTSKDAEKLAFEIGDNIRVATEGTINPVLVISRSDSTLRGHYPVEVNALVQGMQLKDVVTFIIPAFFEGGRYTIGDTHYVMEQEKMIPAADTAFARDKVFGYQSSDLREWVLEKTGNAVQSSQIKSLSLKELRVDSLELLGQKMERLTPGDICIVNATEYQDLKKLTLAVLRSSITPLFRTAASFVAAIAAQPPRPLLSPSELTLPVNRAGLVVVGSYVPKTTEQLQHLRTHLPHYDVEIDVQKLIQNRVESPSQLAREIDQQIKEGRLVILYTSRKLISASTDQQNLVIGQKVSNYLSDIVSKLSIAPRFLITKGGITSSDVTTQSLLAVRAMIRGQIMPGVPVWELGPESRFPGLYQIVFPGNVGDIASVTEVAAQLSDKY
ncbi:MAG: hypothetical protein HKN76_11765 [Saprospiraceae bacterium]|nr:hypothetical protein [Saprospiraceae bacterium]